MSKYTAYLVSNSVDKLVVLAVPVGFRSFLGRNGVLVHLTTRRMCSVVECG